MKSSNPNSPLVKATLLLTSTLTVMAGATIAPSLPGMQEHFADVPNAEYWVKLILTIPALFIVIGAPIAGIMVDRIGRKPLLAAAVLLYGVAGSSGVN
jgi:MFS family permease